MIKEIYPHHLACLTYHLNVTSKSVLAKNLFSKHSCLLSKQIDKPAFTKFLEQFLFIKIHKQNKIGIRRKNLHKLPKLRSHKYKMSWTLSNLHNFLS
jgi:hypothetical protein